MYLLGKGQWDYDWVPRVPGKWLLLIANWEASPVGRI